MNADEKEELRHSIKVTPTWCSLNKRTRLRCRMLAAELILRTLWICVRYRPDYLVVCGAYPLIGGIVARCFGLIKRLGFWSFEYFSHQDANSLLCTLGFYNKGFSLLDAYVDVDEHRGRAFAEEWGLKCTTFCIPNTRLASESPFAPDRKKLLEMIGVSEPVRIVLYCGGVRRQSLDLILEAFVRLPTQNKCLAMFLSDDPEMLDLARSMVEMRALGEQARIIPPVGRAEMFPLLCAADVGIAFYDHRENKNINYLYCNPSKVYDYMASGLVTVTSDNPPLRRLVQDCGWGYCCNPYDSDMVSQRMQDILTDHSKTREMSLKARDYFHSKCSLESLSSPFLDHLTSSLD